jgi:tetratricopeptide (TPR) repeat protein
MKRSAIAIGLLLLFGAVRLPLEIRLQKEQQQAGFNSVQTLSLRQKIGQESFIAALSGFRSLVAALLYIDVYDSWQRLEWGTMAGKLHTITTLQPKSTLYWDMAGWHMGWNAYIAALEDKKQPSKTLRELKARGYLEEARKFYTEGIENNPDNAELWGALGRLEGDKFEDHLAASKAFAAAASKPNALPYLARRSAYELAQVPGHEQEAYDRLKALYDKGEKEHLPALITNLKQLEEKLGIPADQRIKEEDSSH